MYPEPMLRLIEELAKFPGIGRKTAERLAFYVLKTPAAEAMKLAYAIRDLKKKTRNCSLCNNLTEAELCRICADSKRDTSLLCVVEQPRDLIAIEKLERYRGRYHVLLGNLALLEGIEAKDLAIAGLIARLRRSASAEHEQDRIREVILATNPNLDGDATALYLAEELKDQGVKITHLARGLPSGGSIEAANRANLFEAFARRTAL